jgi:hypothetical protein
MWVDHGNSLPSVNVAVAQLKVDGLKKAYNCYYIHEIRCSLNSNGSHYLASSSLFIETVYDQLSKRIPQRR